MAPFYVKDLHDLNCVACRGSRDGLCYCVVRTYILHSSTLKRANYMKEEQAQLSRNPALGCRIMSGIQHSRHPFPPSLSLVDGDAGKFGDFQPLYLL